MTREPLDSWFDEQTGGLKGENLSTL